MTNDTSTVADALEDARRAWQVWQDAWADVQQAMRTAGMSTARIEAYRVGTGYDEGGGQSLEGWLDEIEALLDGQEQQDCDGFRGENAWGPCSRCGWRLEDHTAEPARR